MKSHKKQILRLLENHGDSLSTKQIRGALGLNKTATAKLKAELLKLIKAGKISKQGTRYFKAQEKPKHAVSKEKRKEAKEAKKKVELEITDEDESRMNIIGQNGNDGQHYDSYDNTPEDY